jgi:hypothetical protein
MIDHNNPLLEGYRSPELMAIGDSLYNGVRSLTIDRDLCSLSAPAQIASALGLFFRNPDYPRKVLFDIEDLMRGSVSAAAMINGLRTSVRKNTTAWLANDAWSEQTFFDNIAIGGAAIDNLWTDKAARFRPEIAARLGEFEASEFLNFGVIAELYYDINAAFVLNPTRNEKLDGLSPLDQVRIRRPKRLLVNIGSNEGLFRSCLEADFDLFAADIAKIPGKMSELAERLAPCLKHTERVYFNGLVKPSTVANLWTRKDFDEKDPTPGQGKYHKTYVGRLGFIGSMSGTELARFDTEIARINEAVRQVLAKHIPDSKLRCVDVFSLSARHDFKHDGDAEADPVLVGGNRLKNYPLSVIPFHRSLRHGGLFGIDNLHPSAVGYSLLAQEVVNQIVADEGLDPVTINRTAVFERDTLLQNLPRLLDIHMFLFSFAGLLLGVRQSQFRV